VKRFAELLTVLDHTTRTGAKVDAIAAELRAALAADDVGRRADAAWTVYLLAGQRHRRVLTSRALRAAFERISGLPAWLIEQAYAHVGDGAETVALLLRGERRAGRLAPRDGADLDAPLHVWMGERIPALADLDDERRDARLAGWWTRLPEDQLYVLNKLLTGGLRVGVSKRLVERALAQAADLPRERVTHRLIGDLDPTPEAFAAWTAPDDGGVPPSQPYPFLLAPALRGPDDLPGGAEAWWAEVKLDGIRAQIVRRAGEAHLWSRGEERIARAFPELVAAAETLPDGTVLDGEIVAWGEDGPAAFGALQPRLGRVAAPPALRRRAPVRFVAYDLLERGGEDLRERPLERRRAALHALLGTGDDGPVDAPAWPGDEAPTLLISPRLAYHDVADLDALRDAARGWGGEGLMLKGRATPYGVGRVHGAWWKHKVEPFRLDAVLLYAQAGSGRRSGLFTDLTLGLWDGDELVPFAKAYSGLSDREFTRLGRWVRAHTTERFGPVRAVPPVQVFELAFEGIWRNARRKSGLGVRFPRIVRWREDKPAAEADTLDAARALLEAAS
jgi:DNA ligase-1